MIEMVFALLLLQDHKIIEHRYHETLSKCLKAKRYAMKDKSNKDRVVYKCLQSKANIEIYMGEKKILSLILECVVLFVVLLELDPDSYVVVAVDV